MLSCAAYQSASIFTRTLRPLTNALYIFGPISGRVGPGGNCRELQRRQLAVTHMSIQVHHPLAPRVVRDGQRVAEVVVQRWVRVGEVIRLRPVLVSVQWLSPAGARQSTLSFRILSDLCSGSLNLVKNFSTV